VRGVPRGHVQCVPKWRITLMFAQVRAVPGRVCKIAGDSLPGFESWTCHQNPQVKPGARTGPSDGGERCRTPPMQPARTQNRPAASSKKPGDQPGCENTPPGLPPPRGRTAARSGSCAKYVPKNPPLRRLPWARHASRMARGQGGGRPLTRGTAADTGCYYRGSAWELGVSARRRGSGKPRLV
jgi:hypothetical protein